jgi:HD superfamily phosphodiesterase
MTTENKRINIQYSINLSELPDEVERLYQKALKEFKSIDFPEDIKDNILDFSTAKRADEIRQKIAKLDLILSDVQSIVTSYVEYEIASKNPEPEVPAGIPRMADMPDISNIDLEEMSKLFNSGNENELQEPNQRSE